MPHNLPLSIGNYKYKAGNGRPTKYRKGISQELKALIDKWEPLRLLEDESIPLAERLDAIYIRFFEFSHLDMVCYRLNIGRIQTLNSYMKRDKALESEFRRWLMMRNATWTFLGAYYKTNPFMYAFLSKLYGIAASSRVQDEIDSKLELMYQGLQRSAKRIEARMQNGHDVFEMEPETRDRNGSE